MTRKEVTPKHLTSSWPAKKTYTAPQDEPRSEDTKQAIKDNFERRPEDDLKDE